MKITHFEFKGITQGRPANELHLAAFIEAHLKQALKAGIAEVNGLNDGTLADG
jgi:hypothetical protein